MTPPIWILVFLPHCPEPKPVKPQKELLHIEGASPLSSLRPEEQ